MSQPPRKEWMNVVDRFSDPYLDGVKEFIKFVESKNEGLTTCACPCLKCKNKKSVSLSNVRKHLIVHGILSTYRVWTLHGEIPSEHLVVDKEKVEVETVGDEGFGMENLVNVSYEVHREVLGNDDIVGHVEEPNLPKRYTEYKEKAKEKLYPSCSGSDTTLSAIVKLHNLKNQYGWSGTSVTALLGLIKTWLPEGNTLPQKFPIMKKMLKDLGMKAKCIHACVYNCILYWKEHEHAEECFQCEESRYRVREVKTKKKISKEPRKVLRHFPLIPRLNRLYSIPWIARDMTWHARATPSYDYMRHPIDSSQWRTFKLKYPDFAEERRNIWLGIATDGFNPRGLLSSSYSVWPVIIVPYNLPPSLCMKSEFQMLSLLIPRPKAPSQDFDVFLEPLVDELKQLWEEGVPAFDMHKMEHFRLRAMLTWGIHDFPAYGNLSGCITHGYKACPACGDEVDSTRLVMSSKIVYTNYRRFLEMDHPFRDGKHLGLKTKENKPPPQRLKGVELLQALDRVKYTPGKKRKSNTPKTKSRKRRRADENECDVDREEGGGEVTQAWYRRSILFDLSYWKDHKIQHVIDVMHVEKNVIEHLLNTIFDVKDKTKDTIKARGDMKNLRIHRGQHVYKDKDSGKVVKPKATFVLEREEKKHFVQILKDLKLPSGFSSNLSNVVTITPPALHIIKSHDYHIVMQYLIPVLLQHAFPKNRDLRRAINQISLFFKLLCSKVLDRKTMQDAKYMVAEAYCVLEKHFPPSFFVISVHLVMHLADEALVCGPTPYRWMYPFERSMKDFKDIPSNKRYVEGSIAESYLVSESVRYAMEYIPNSQEGSFEGVEDGEYNPQGFLEGKTVMITPTQFVQIRRWVLFRAEVEGLTEYYSAYKEEFVPTSGKGKRPAKKKVEIQTEFIGWLYDKLLEVDDTKSQLWQLVKGPDFKAKTYKKYAINGYVFSPRYHDDTVVTQNSGVCMKAITPFQSSSKDKNPTEALTTWYGFINEIMELDYTDFQIVVFYCDWVRVEDKTNGCKLCPDSNLVMVNFDRLTSADKQFDEPVILASDASQVFYSKDLKNPHWWVVIHSPKRPTSQIDNLDIPTDSNSIFVDQPNLVPLMKRFS